MWCPNCKNEYVAGITRCADCGIPLVEELPEELQTEEEVTPVSFPKEAVPEVSHAYVSKKTRTEDMKSTAYTFTLVAVLGILLLILFATGVLPLQTAGSTKIMICIVMGAVFLIFLFIGVRAFGELKTLGEDAVTEEALFSEITEWFLSAYAADDIDASLDKDQPEETLYFSRYEVMSRMITETYPGLEEAFWDHIIETLYGKIFS